ncbi:MAG: response regulator, partial [Opitutaceae bacterium]
MPSKILVIDDDLALRRTLEIALQTFGYEAILAADGRQGIALARETQPDLILCDVNMPGMDGRAVLQAMRNDPALANRQVVLMTGNQTQNPQREGMNLGADDYLPKPFEIAQLRT